MSSPGGAGDRADEAAEEVSAAIERVEHLRALGRHAEAERAAREALSTAPGSPGLLLALSSTLLSTRNSADGLVAAEAALAGAPELESAHRLRALHLSQLGRHAEAQQAGYTAVGLEPLKPGAAMAYALVLKRAGRLAEAEQVARRAVELAPQSPDALLVLADVASDRPGRAARSRARAAYEETLRLDPLNAEARHDLAVLDARSRRPMAALAGLVVAGRLDPTLPTVLDAVGAVLWQLAWRMRMWFIASVIVVIAAGGQAPTDSTTGARIAATLVLVLTAGLVTWTLRGAPAGTGRVIRAALRRDRPLAVTYAALALCLLLFVTVVATGTGLAAAGVWLVLMGLAVLAVVVGWIRRMRR